MTFVVRAAFVRIPAALRQFTAGVSAVPVAGATVREALQDLTKRHPQLRSSVLGEDGELHTLVSVCVGRDDVRSRGGLDSLLEDGIVLSIVPTVSGATPLARR